MMFINVVCAYMVCINVIDARFPRHVLHKAINSCSSSYDRVFTVGIAIGRRYCISVGSYRTCYELVLKHISVVWLVHCTSLLCYIVGLCLGKETLLQGITELCAFFKWIFAARIA